MDSKEREWIRKMGERQRLSRKVEDLWSEVSLFDDGVKVRVLSGLLNGKSPEEFGKDYFDILEGFDQNSVPDGQIEMVGDVEFDPAKFK